MSSLHKILTRKSIIMKKISILLLALLSFSYAYTQEDYEDEMENNQEMQTLFNRGVSYGGYGAPELKLTNFNQNPGLMVGGHGGFIMNHKVIIGGGGYGLVTNSRFNDDTLNLGTGYGGFRMEYICCSHKLVHFTIPVLVGAGGVGVMEKNKDQSTLGNFNWDSNDDEDYEDDWDDWHNWDVVESSAYFVVEPGVNVELNIVKYFRIAMGGSYRYVAGTDLDLIKDSDLSDFSFNLSLKFGVF